MNRRLIIVALAVVAIAGVAIRVLSHPDLPEEKVFRAAGANYRLGLTRYSQGEGLLCPPFRLNVYHDRQPDLKRGVMFAEQADDVVIAQTPTVIYVFYNELVLHDFGNWIADERDAKLQLCDVNVSACASEMKRLVSSGTKMQRICGRAHN